ncbi:carph-isopro domain-containing protein [Actinoplanes sp. HUAS TT8]|uniref:carph-isopro domain-containing protein n=1 Tax=Actinoplanes sp. HUAS TT8 TaxID=3447453 RepID=UPI003F51C495
MSSTGRGGDPTVKSVNQAGNDQFTRLISPLLRSFPGGGVTTRDRANKALAGYLIEAGMTPRALSRELNRRFGPATLAETAPYHWRDAGGVPRSPLPALAAYVLSRRLGRRVTPADLWPGVDVPAGGTLVVDSSVGMAAPWTAGGLLHIAEDWLLGGLVDRRLFLTVSGSALARAVTVFLNDQTLIGETRPPATVDDPLVDQIESTVPKLQVLDDEQGGASGLQYVGAQMRAVMLLLHEGGHSDSTRLRLLRVLADLAQLAGWKAFDAAQNGLAQRYLFTGLRAAHEAGYRPMAAHILADLSFQAASLGDVVDGVTLGEASRRVAARSAPSVRASVDSRLAFAYAAAGRPRDCERAWLQSREHLTHRAAQCDPEWMYYLTANHLDCQAGYAMILAGRNAVDAGDRSNGRALLRRGAGLLRTGAYRRPVGLPYQRRAMYEGAWLALGYAAHGKLDDACAVAELALPRLERVRSPRSTALLTTLAVDLRRRKRHHTVERLLPRLEQALGNSGQRSRTT